MRDARVLVLEDDPTRQHWFRQRFAGLDLTANVNIAIEAATARSYDLIFIDHDLGTEPVVGRDFAAWLGQHPEAQPGARIIVHSVNVVSAPKIVRELDAAGRRAEWIPFPELCRA